MGKMHHVLEQYSQIWSIEYSNPVINTQNKNFLARKIDTRYVHSEILAILVT